MDNLGEAAEELEGKLLLRSAVDVQRVEFQKLFKGWAKDANLVIEYEAIEKISIQFADVHREYISNAY